MSSDIPSPKKVCKRRITYSCQIQRQTSHCMLPNRVFDVIASSHYACVMFGHDVTSRCQYSDSITILLVVLYGVIFQVPRLDGEIPCCPDVISDFLKKRAHVVGGGTDESHGGHWIVLSTDTFF